MYPTSQSIDLTPAMPQIRRGCAPEWTASVAAPERMECAMNCCASSSGTSTVTSACRRWISKLSYSMGRSRPAHLDASMGHDEASTKDLLAQEERIEDVELYIVGGRGERHQSTGLHSRASCALRRKCKCACRKHESPRRRNERGACRRTESLISLNAHPIATPIAGRHCIETPAARAPFRRRAHAAASWTRAAGRRDRRESGPCPSRPWRSHC